MLVFKQGIPYTPNVVSGESTIIEALSWAFYAQQIAVVNYKSSGIALNTNPTLNNIDKGRALEFQIAVIDLNAIVHVPGRIPGFKPFHPATCHCQLRTPA